MTVFERKARGDRPAQRVETDIPVERVRLLADGFTEVSGKAKAATDDKPKAPRQRNRKPAETKADDKADDKPAEDSK